MAQQNVPTTSQPAPATAAQNHLLLNSAEVHHFMDSFRAYARNRFSRRYRGNYEMLMSSLSSEYPPNGALHCFRACTIQRLGSAEVDIIERGIFDAALEEFIALRRRQSLLTVVYRNGMGHTLNNELLWQEVGQEIVEMVTTPVRLWYSLVCFQTEVEAFNADLINYCCYLKRKYRPFRKQLGKDHPNLAAGVCTHEIETVKRIVKEFIIKEYHANYAKLNTTNGEVHIIDYLNLWKRLVAEIRESMNHMWRVAKRNYDPANPTFP